ncbi:hypothetical protein XSR1_710008 [Xenorhabdus szentirmaii DSM 16338]|uniref:Uncharacterized protein n=1 Tax=Xenorhabdus szentirmaii DSM 16338 TaxID=1427518 RepID=W1J414_9GAMM|nr:hypothetical protein XSR1_710008 [Xenorhabdus szentirmaii DSM 16338]
MRIILTIMFHIYIDKIIIRKLCFILMLALFSHVYFIVLKSVTHTYLTLRYRVDI